MRYIVHRTPFALFGIMGLKNCILLSDFSLSLSILGWLGLPFGYRLGRHRRTLASLVIYAAASIKVTDEDHSIMKYVSLALILIGLRIIKWIYRYASNNAI